MLELAEFKNAELRSEDRLEERYASFDRRLREMEAELELYPYARLTEIIAWAEHLKICVGKLRVIREYSIEASQKEWNRLEDSMLDYVRIDRAFISILSKHILYLAKLDERYRQRLYIFTNKLDNSVRYLKSYIEDLEKQGFSLSGILAESRNLSDMNWLSITK